MDDSAPPCMVCGGTDLNLVAGYYYCVECGTQDQTIRETVVEHTTREDGTSYITKTKKITIKKEKKDLSPEWYKWHAYNLMMAGFADELVSLGAGEEFKLRLLWIWAKYVCSRRVDEAGRTAEDVCREIDGHDSSSEQEERRATKSIHKKYMLRGRVNMSIMQAMLYAALNASYSDIQSGDLRRFIKEERVSCRNCLKFLPDDFDYRKVDSSERILTTACVDASSETIRGLAMSVYKEFDLGVPRAADLHMLVDRYVTELLLPEDFRQMALSLMDFIPVTCDLVFGVGGVPRIPNYEGVAMAYVVMTLKIFFGLDDVYENILSEAAERYNELHEFPKAYKQNFFEIETGRLFSFREWMTHLEYRAKVISKHYFPVALDNNEEIDARAFMSHTKDRHKHKTAIDVSDDVMMEVLGRIPADVETFITPEVKFPPTLTPMTTYTEVLLSKIHDPVQKELLGEDFSKYSLKYITGEIQITGTMLSGVDSENVVIISRNAKVAYTQQRKLRKNDKKLVYVRDCENQDWIKTKQPKAKHVRVSEEEEYVSNNESDSSATEDDTDDLKTMRSNVDEIRLTETEENIFNNVFDVLESEDWSVAGDKPDVPKEFQSDEASVTRANYTLDNEQLVNVDSFQQSLLNYDSGTFDRNAAIKLLVEEVAEEYKISTRDPKPKRRMFVPNNYNDEPRPKRPRKKRDDKELSDRAHPGDAMREVESIKDLYYSILKEKKDLASMAHTEERCDVGTPVGSIDHEVPSNELQEMNGYLINQQENVLNLEEKKLVETSDTNQPADKNGTVKHVDSSDSEYEKENHSVAIPKNENFKDKYDTRQLYLKVKPGEEVHSTNGEINEENVDTEIADLVHKKEEKLSADEEAINYQKENSRTKDRVDTIKQNYEEIVISELIGRLNHKTKKSRENDDMDQIRPYKYWIVSYEGCSSLKHFRSGVTDKELDRYFPRSFAWVFKMCARTIQSDTRSLYIQLNNLEDDLKNALAITNTS